MAIVNRTPFRDLDLMERRVRRWVEEFGFAPALAPAADIYETEGEFVVELDLPGYEQTELSIEVSDHTLAIKGEHEKVDREKRREFALRERLERDFERRFILPAEADTGHAKATFARGVLEVHTPKLAKARPKKIPIA